MTVPNSPPSSRTRACVRPLDLASGTAPRRRASRTPSRRRAPRRSGSGRCRRPSPRAPAIGFDEVTNGYVPWSRSSSVPCAPSKQHAIARRAAPGRRAATCRRRTGAAAARSPRARRRRPRASSGSALVDALEPDVLLGERDLDLLAQDLRVEQVLDADADPRRLVRVRRADAAPRRADLELAEPALARLVDRDVPRHDQVRVAGDADSPRSRCPRASRSSSSSISTSGSTTQPAPSTHALPGEDPGRDLAELVRLAVDDDRVAGVRAALVAADEVRVLRRAGRRSCPCPRRPTARRRSRSRARPECARRRRCDLSAGSPGSARRSGISCAEQRRIVTCPTLLARSASDPVDEALPRSRGVGSSTARRLCADTAAEARRLAAGCRPSCSRDHASRLQPPLHAGRQVGELRVALEERELDRVGRAVAVLGEITSASPCWSDSSL